MAESSQKKRGPGRPPGSKNKTVNHAAAPNRQEQIEEMQRKYDRDRRNVDVIWSITFVAIGLFLFFTVVMDTTGSFGGHIHNFCLGLFGNMAFALPFLVFIFAIFLLAGKLQHIGWKTFLFSFLIYLNLCILNSYRFLVEDNLKIGFSDIADQYRNAIQGIDGGVLGMEIGGILVKLFGKPGLLIIAITVMLISIFLVANTPISRFVETTIKNREKKKMLAQMNKKYEEELLAEAAEQRAAAAAASASSARTVTSMPEPVASTERRKGIRALDMEDTIVMSAEEFRQHQMQYEQTGILGSVKSMWRSLVGGMTSDDSEISRIPSKNVIINQGRQPDLPTNSAPTDIPKPFGNRQGSKIIGRNTIEMDPITGDFSRATTAQSRVIVQDPNPSELAAAETDRDTLFGRLAKRFTGYFSGDEPASSEPDYGYPGDRRRQEQREVKSNARPGYGLGDPNAVSHSGAYGLDGHPKGGAVGLAPTVPVQKEAAVSAADETVATLDKAESETKKASQAKTVKKSKEAAVPLHSESNAEEDAKIAAGFDAQSDDSAYELPPVSLLKRGSGHKHIMSQAEVGDKAALLEKTLNDFGVEARVINVTQGASVTRYEVQPATGVKVAKIVRLADDIALNMRAKTVRIEAPIPGKAAVGIEVENSKPSPVLIRELIDSEEFMGAQSKIEFVVGKDISGNNIVADMKDMPHLLVAGATGSGKSVCINSIITSFLYKAKPSELKLIMIDPKMVELGNYNGIPHMLTPVVTDPRKAARALAIAVDEMEKRYELFSKEYVKDLGSYNEKMRHERRYADCKPEIIIIIDELADLMMAAPNDVENAICRLAQKARAAGMHLIVATQRPSVDVVTGLIKANIPSRIAFTTTSSIDSRTILDTTGAEKLLGKGDMLFSPVGATKPYRVQGPFISSEEIEKVIKFVKKEGGDPEYDEELKTAIDNLEQKGGSDPQDELTEDAIQLFLKSGQASTSMLQRRFRIGYNRAARIMDEIEDLGIIGASDGSNKARQVLITEEQYYGGLDESDEIYEEPISQENTEPEDALADDIIEEYDAEDQEYETYVAPPDADEEDYVLANDLDDDPVLNELERTQYVKPEDPDEDVMDSASDGSSIYNTGVNAFNSLSPEQQAKILDADYEDEY